MRLNEIYVGVVFIVVDVAKHFATNTDCQKIYDQTVSHSQNSWCSLSIAGNKTIRLALFINQVAWKNDC